MKFASILFAATVVSSQASDDSHRGLATLAQKWNITDPQFEYEGLGFTLEYGLTTYILDNYGMVRWSIWDENCKPTDGSAGHLIWDQDDVTAQKAGISAVSGTGTGLRLNYPQVEEDLPSGKYTVDIQLDSNTISTNSFLYSEDTNEGQLSAEIRLCNRVELWTPTKFADDSANPTPFEVNFLETLITLTVDLTDGFEIGAINVEAKDRVVRTANQVYQVIGFLCGTDNVAVDPTEAGRTRNQGEVVRVCVKPDAEAEADQIKMRSIDSFSFTRDSFTQTAIVGNAEAPNLLTTYSPTLCRGSGVCFFETILFANFYTSVGQVAGAGVASMQFGTSRRLRSGGRNAQAEDDVAAASEFELEFNVAQTAETPSGASSIGSTIGMAAGLFSVVALLM